MKTMIAVLAFLVASSAAAQEYERKIATLTESLKAAPDARTHMQTAFTIARTHEEWAAADPEHADEHLRAALKSYALLWVQEPRTPDAEAAAHNNCAQIYVKLGEDARAAEQFKAAIAAGGSMRGFYLVNYADFLAARGERDAAAAFYRKALSLLRDDVTTEEKALRVYPGPRVVEHLRALVDQNALGRAQRLALEHLGRDHDPAVKRDLLAIVATTLAKQHASEIEFPRPLLADPAAGDGVRELLRLLSGQALDPAGYSWWREPGENNRAPMAFSMLARELGEQSREKSPEQAEAYFKLAIAISDGSDPDPFVSLADLYYSSGRIAELERFSEIYRDKMFETKGAAYRTSDWRSIYRFHVALGTIYARLGWAGDETNPRSAIYHLEHARTAAEHLSVQTGTKVLLDPRSVDLLATSYAKAQPQSSKDLQVRLQMGEAYATSGRITSAKRVLEPAAADPRIEKGEEKIRFDRLRSTVPMKVNPAAFTPSTTLKNIDTAAHAARVVPRETTVRVTSGGGLDAAVIANLERLLADYYSASPELRPDLESKLHGFGVTTIHEPVKGKGSVEVRDGRATVTVLFEVK